MALLPPRGWLSALERVGGHRIAGGVVEDGGVATRVVPDLLTSAGEVFHRRRVTGSGVAPQVSPSRNVTPDGIVIE